MDKATDNLEKVLKGWAIKTDNKARGMYGETDYNKKVIRINKKRHKSKTARKLTPNKDGSENMLTTLAHEVEHVRRPKENSEKKIEKIARKKVKKMSSRQKAKLRAKLH